MPAQGELSGYEGDLAAFDLQRLVDYEGLGNRVSIPLINQVSGIGPGSRILEVAGGPGTKLAQYYAKKGVKVYILDKNEQYLERHEEAEATRQLDTGTERRVFPILGDARENELPLLIEEELGKDASDAFTVVHSRNFTAYIDDDRREKMMEEFAYMTNGGLVVANFNWGAVLERDDHSAFRDLAVLSSKAPGFNANQGADDEEEARRAMQTVKGMDVRTKTRTEAFSPSRAYYPHVLTLAEFIVKSTKEAAEAEGAPQAVRTVHSTAKDIFRRVDDAATANWEGRRVDPMGYVPQMGTLAMVV